MARQINFQQVEKLIGQLNEDSPDLREGAALSLSQTFVPSKVPQAVKQRLAVEQDFNVMLALSYALASQGDRTGLRPLIDSLSQSSHKGYRYLRLSTGKDFGWNADDYRRWFDRTSDQSFQELVVEKWRRKRMRDEYSEFSLLFAKRYYGSTTAGNTGELARSNQRLSDSEKEKLETLSTAKAWRLLTKALTLLNENGDRKATAELLRELVENYPDTVYTEQALELLPLLMRMIAEDDERSVPDNFALLPVARQIEFHIASLRDARAHQYSQPGSCQLEFLGSSNPKNKNYNPATALLKIGKPATRSLVAIFDDRRPVRGVGYWRISVPRLHVLRYGDAAEQILSKIEQQ